MSKECDHFLGKCIFVFQCSGFWCIGTVGLISEILVSRISRVPCACALTDYRRYIWTRSTSDEKDYSAGSMREVMKATVAQLDRTKLKNAQVKRWSGRKSRPNVKAWQSEVELRPRKLPRLNTCCLSLLSDPARTQGSQKTKQLDFFSKCHLRVCSVVASFLSLRPDFFRLCGEPQQSKRKPRRSGMTITRVPCA